jgi:hypothetical protein
MSKGKTSNDDNTADKEAMINILSEMRTWMKDQFSTMAKEFKEFKEKKTSEVDCLEDAIWEMSEKLNFYEQKELNRVMDIDGLHLDGIKDVRNFVINYITTLGIQFSPSDIINAYVYTKRQRSNERKAIRVTFLHEFAKYQVMRQKIRMHRNNSTSVFFSHVLTRSNLAILMEGKKLKNEGKIADIKFLNGRLYAFLLNGTKTPIESTDRLLQAINDEKPLIESDKIKTPIQQPEAASNNAQKSTPVSSQSSRTKENNARSINEKSNTANYSISPSTSNLVLKNDQTGTQTTRSKKKK